MNTRFHGFSLAVAFALVVALGPATLYGQNGAPPVHARDAVSGTPNGTAFTYQGQLRKAGAPVNAVCAFTFTLWDAASSGVQIGPTASAPAVAVAGGLFSANLDFGTGAMNGESRWLEAQVQCPGDGSPVALSPRTALLPAPYALALPGMRTPRGNNDGNGLPTVSVIGGTVSNTIAPDSILSAIGGGTLNAIGGDSGGSVIAGGNTNVITDVSYNSTLGGGYGNRIYGRSSTSFLGGGLDNKVAGNSDLSALSGGSGNTITGTSQAAFIGGGANNNLSGSYLGVVSGGYFNVLEASRSGTIAGGEKNTLRTGQYGSISGGVSNTIEGSDNGIIVGGFNNKVTGGSHYSVIGGGANNRANLTSTLSFIGGGDINVIENNSYKSLIGGGELNTIQNDSSYGVISGGWTNLISEGSQWSAIGGGHANTITGTANYAAIPGGENNRVSGDYALAAGRRAQALHNGSFVWGDATDANIASTAPNQFVIRASGGVSLPVNAGEGGIHPFGERWRDNAIQAWAVMRADGLIYASYGVSTVTHTTGSYTFTLQVGAQDNTRLAPVVSPEIDAPPTSAAAARLASINNLNGTTFVVYITNGSYALVDNDFMVIVTGR